MPFRAEGALCCLRMSEHIDQPAPSANHRCLVCSERPIEGKAFCPSCGAKAVPSSTLSVIDAYIQKKIDLELSNRLKDTRSIVRELGDKVEGVVWNRLRLATWAVGLFLIILAFLGWNTYRAYPETLNVSLLPLSKGCRKARWSGFSETKMRAHARASGSMPCQRRSRHRRIRLSAACGAARTRDFTVMMKWPRPRLQR